ncbi:MAG: hypothetical protein IKL82_02715 [Clostridia bacterium]|nr:hypothetical protein [Clostridia bacterium]
MKKLLILTLAVLLAFSLIACKKAPIVIKESDSYVVINVQKVEDNVSLASYMNSLEEYSNMFVIENGMVMAINGLYNDTVSWTACWMLYTDDVDNSDTAYSIEYKDKVYGSALYGAESLIVKNGCTYIWIYQTF